MFRGSRWLSALLLLLLPGMAAASTAPTTPTFVLAWGDNGPAVAQFAGPAGVATDAVGNVFVVDQGNHRVQKFDRLGNFLLQWGSFGGASGQFNYPLGVAVDAAGNVYIADANNHRVQKFTGSGVWLTQWGSNGTGNGQFNSPYCVALDAAGNVYVTDALNHRVQKFSAVGGYITQWGSGGSGNGQFAYPFGVAIDPAGNVYVGDAYNHRVQKFNASGTYLAQWGSYGSGTGQFNYPVGVVTDAVGNVYVADQSNHRIQKFSATGTYLTQWGSNGSDNGQFNYPVALAADAAGNLYVADASNHRIQKFSSAGAALSDPPAAFLLNWGSNGGGNGQFNNPASVATDAAGNVYVADLFNARIQKFTGTGTYLTQWGTPGSGDGQFSLPHDVATDAAGNVYVADLGNNRIQKFAGTGTYITQWGTPGGGNGQFNRPRGVATDAAGSVYVVDRDNSRIQKFSNTGTYLTQWGSYGSGNGLFSNPIDVATDDDGSVYVADQNNSRIQKFTGAGTYLTQWSGPFILPTGVATDDAGNVYVSNPYEGRIHKFTGTGSGTFLTEWVAFGGSGELNIPAGVATDVAGDVYVADPYNHRIQKFVTPPAIALVSDVRNDQGRQVRLRVLRASADSPGSGTTILRYDVYRRIDPLPGAASPLAAAAASADIERRRADPAAPGAVQLAGWEQVGSMSARGDAEYNIVVPTLADATSASLEFSAFFVSAVTADPLTFYDSGVENGFSIDNLSPPAPTPFTAAYAEGGTHLHWGLSPAADFATFRLYRGTGVDFVPWPGTMVAATTDTGYVDAGPAGSYYKLSAIDFNGNEGPYTTVGPNQTTGVPAAPAVAFALEGARPNPAIGSRMVVHFVLPSAEPATLELVDLAGRRVMERAVGSLGAGRHAVDLAGGRHLKPGLYFVRLAQGANERVVRMTLLN